MTVSFDLDKVKRLAKHLGSPHATRSRYIHIAGVNGKTSTALFLTKLLQESTPLRIGTFIYPPGGRTPATSILVDGKPLGEGHWKELREHVIRTDELFATGCSAYEKLVLAALLAFRELGCHLLVVESALGGMADATRVLTEGDGGGCGEGSSGRQVAAVITNCSFDHPAYLGGQLEDIARNMMSIVERTTGAFGAVPVIVASEQPPEAGGAFAAYGYFAKATSSIDDQSLFAGNIADFVLPMPTDLQVNNIELALRTLEAVMPKLEAFFTFRRRSTPLPPSIFANICIPSGWRSFHRGGKWLLVDGAQNDASPLFPWVLSQLADRSVHWLLGVSAQKDDRVIERFLQATGMKSTMKYSLVSFRTPADYSWIHPIEPAHFGSLFPASQEEGSFIQLAPIPAFSTISSALTAIREKVVIICGSPYIVHDFYLDFTL